MALNMRETYVTLTNATHRMERTGCALFARAIEQTPAHLSFAQRWLKPTNRPGLRTITVAGGLQGRRLGDPRALRAGRPSVSVSVSVRCPASYAGYAIPCGWLAKREPAAYQAGQFARFASMRIAGRSGTSSCIS